MSDDDEAKSLTAPLVRFVKSFRKKRGDAELREALEELIDQAPEGEQHAQAAGERALLANILKLRGVTVKHVMIPRADVVAIEAGMNLHALIDFITREGHSRFPIYRGELDEVIGMIHLKDLLPYVNRPNDFIMQHILREVVVVAPTMPVLDLLVEMRQSRRHMAMVVDEFGGMDGLVTIEDLVEEIVGEIEDEHDEVSVHEISLRPDGTLVADGRLPLDELEVRTGRMLEDEARENVETLGGLLFFLAGRVPGRGELIEHDNGTEFEVLEADSRRVKRVRIRPVNKASSDHA